METEDSLPHSQAKTTSHYPELAQSHSPPISWRTILILSSHLRLGLPSCLFPTGFPTKHLYTPLLSPYVLPAPTHLIILDFITLTIFGDQYRSLSSSLCSFLHSPVTPSLLGPNILLSNLFSNLEVRHPLCFGSITKNFCILHVQSNTTIFHPVVQYVYNYMFRPICWPSSGCDLT